MKNEVNIIKNKILAEINPESIYFRNMGPITLLVVVWNIDMSSFEKRVYIRRILKFVSVPFDIAVYSSEELEKELQKKESLTFDVVKNGTLLFSKELKTIAM